jgi:predicted phosphate transport protein (TIGR00153 family)
MIYCQVETKGVSLSTPSLYLARDWSYILVKFLITPRDTKFYDLFEKDTANLVTAAEKLVDFFDNYEDVAVKAKQLKNLEHQGDIITHEIIQRLHRTFVTPIDREDIARLAQTLDDVMDFIEAAGRTAFFYGITQPTERARQLTLIVAKVTYQLNEVLPRLRHRDQFPRILEQCVEINSLENEADDVFHAALAELFDSCTSACEIIKWREIYQHLEDATDRGEDVANVLEGIVLKHA